MNLDKKIDILTEEVKEMKVELKELKGEIKELVEAPNLPEQYIMVSILLTICLFIHILINSYSNYFN